MFSEEKKQAILMSGESGSGKTFSAVLCM